MTDRMDTEALRALVDLGPLTVSHQNGDPEESFRGIVGPEVITKRGKPVRFYVAQYVLPENAPLFAQAPALAAEVLELRAKLEDFKSSQHYRYIGKDGKPVLARDLEDRATKAEAAVKHANDHADAAIAELAAEKALADDLDGGLKLAQDTIEAASKLLTKKSGTKWGLWYLYRISELRADHRKARGL